jgi:hypothetical protein
VLKVPKRTNPPGSLRASDTGLLGKQTYSKSRGEITDDQPAAQAKIPVTDGPVPGSVPTPPSQPPSQPTGQPARTSDTIPETPSLDLPEIEVADVGLEERSWKEEYAFEETGIAPTAAREELAESGPRTPEFPDFGRPPTAAPTPTPNPASAAPPPGTPQTPFLADPDSSAFKASDSTVKPFSSGSTGTKFPTRSEESSYPAQRNTMDSSLPSSDDFQPTSGSFQAQQQKQGLAGMSPTDLFSNLPDSVNTAPPGMAPPSDGPRTGAMNPGQGLQNFDFSAPSKPPETYGQPPQQGFHEQSGLAPQHAGTTESESVTKFIGRAQAGFGILGGLLLLASLFFALTPLRVPESDMMAAALAMTAMSGIGSITLSLFPVSPGLRGIGFGFLAIVAIGGVGLLIASGSPVNVVVIVPLLAGAGLASVAAIFPAIGKLVS